MVQLKNNRMGCALRISVQPIFQKAMSGDNISILLDMLSKLSNKPAIRFILMAPYSLADTEFSCSLIRSSSHSFFLSVLKYFMSCRGYGLHSGIPAAQSTFVFIFSSFFRYLVRQELTASMGNFFLLSYSPF